MNFTLFGFKIDGLTIFGLSAQFLFFLRFIYQWLASERKKESVIPVEFWYFSILGGILIVVYAFLRHDLVFFLGQTLALFIYFRNLALFKKKDLSSNENKYETKNPIKRFFLKQFLSIINQIITTEKIKTIYDVGCGEGYVLSYLAATQPSLKFTALDNNKKAILKATQRVKKAKFLIADIKQAQPLVTSQTFDLVMALEVLEHLPEPAKILKSLSQIKTKLFLFSVPNEPWFSLGNLLSGKNISRLGRDPGHLNCWRQDDFLVILKKELRIVKTYITPFWIIVLAKNKND